VVTPDKIKDLVGLVIEKKKKKKRGIKKKLKLKNVMYQYVIINLIQESSYKNKIKKKGNSF